MNLQSVILFDGVCNLCNASVNFVIERDHNGEFVFGSLQSEEGISLLKEYDRSGLGLSSIVLIDRTAAGDPIVHSESNAALHILSRLPGIWKLSRVFWLVPAFLRDGIYRFIARNRYRWFGKRDVCRVPTPELEKRFIAPLG